MRVKARSKIRLSTAATPPREFRIFKKGVNSTTKGDFVFDDDSAKSVMEEYEKHGVDIQIDLEHLSLDDEAKNYDPDAYAYCKLALRNGELWAVDVRWNENGAERVKSKKQKYISPAFHYDSETGAITELYNIAICAIPATHEAPALVAASKHAGKKIGTLSLEVKKMDELKKLAALLGLGEDATWEQVFSAIEALQGAGEEEAADEEEEAADEEDESEEATAKKLSKSKLSGKMQAKVLASLAAIPVLTAKIAKLEKSGKTSKVDALLLAHAKKFTPALEKLAREKWTPEQIEAFAAIAPDQDKAPATEPAVEGAGVVKLTAADREVMKLTGESEEKVLAHKQKLAKRDAERAASFKQ